MAERVKLWREDYRHFEENPKNLIEQLAHLKPLIGNDEFETWQELADNHNMSELFERLMANHYDPAYRRSTLRHYPNIDAANTITLNSLSKDALREVASMLIADQHSSHIAGVA